MFSLIIILALSLAFHIFLLLRKFISLYGAILSFVLVVAPAVVNENYIGSLFILLTYFFVFKISLYKKKEKHEIYSNLKQSTAKKSIFNVLGKVLLPSIFASVGANDLLISVLAYGAADSVGSQIGVLSKSSPVLLTTFTKVPPGTNGGISMLGTFGGLITGGILGLLFGSFTNHDVLYYTILGALTGFLGSLIDSILGATIEDKFNLTDWSVNFIASLSTALLSYIVIRIF